MIRTRLFTGALVALLAACSSDGSNPPITGQTGTVSGTVTASGTGVGGVQIALAGATQTSGADGKYSFANVNPGNVSLTLAVPAGYALSSGETAAKSATVAAGQGATVNWSLDRTAAVQTVQVDLQATTFSPSNVTITKGSTIKWVNQTASAHTITPNNAAQAGVWPAQNISGTGTEFSHTFDEAGAFPYRCTIHSGMTGTITVQ
jgi:plastocyanin